MSAEPRRGYRGLGGAEDLEKTRPLACVAALEGEPQQWNELHRQLLLAFQAAARRRGWAMLGGGSERRDPAEVMRQAAGARSWGLILDAIDPKLLAMVRASGIPAVMVDAWAEDAGLDAVIQDGYQGGLLAAAQLAARGHRRVAWFGPTVESAHSMARLAGATMGLLRAGIELPAALRMEPPAGHAPDAVRQQARELLSRSDRPQAILALWQDMAGALAAAARDLGLVAGRDFDMVGWCTEEARDAFCRTHFPGGPIPPLVTWSVRTMAELAISRLVERRSNPNLVQVRINVPVALRAGE